MKPSDLGSNIFDPVQKPQHYQFFPDLETIQIIASTLTHEQYYGYCLGNKMKYHLRAGGKDVVVQEIGKGAKYVELYEQFKHLCKGQ
jgi:hypothetical protein